MGTHAGLWLRSRRFLAAVLATSPAGCCLPPLLGAALAANLTACFGGGGGGVHAPGPKTTTNDPQICAANGGGSAAGGRLADQCTPGVIQRQSTQNPGSQPAPGSPSMAPASQGGAIGPLNAEAPGNAPFKISSYGATLATNKATLAGYLDAAGANAQEKALVIAIAMQETTLMTPGQRDAHKDGTPSANCSVLNINYDMLSQLGYAANDYCSSINNSPTGLKDVTNYLLQGLRKWGIAPTLNFQRGGSTAFHDGTSYGAADYRNAISTIYKQIAADPSLETDDRRVEVNVQGV